MTKKTVPLKAVFNAWQDDREFQKAYEDQAVEFAIAGEIIAARVGAGLTQAELAARMGTTQSTIARLEGGSVLPSTRTLQRVAAATGKVLHISLR